MYGCEEGKESESEGTRGELISEGLATWILLLFCRDILHLVVEQVQPVGSRHDAAGRSKVGRSRCVFDQAYGGLAGGRQGLNRLPQLHHEMLVTTREWWLEVLEISSLDYLAKDTSIRHS